MNRMTTINAIGFMIFCISFGLVMFITGAFMEHPIVNDLLFGMFILGMTTLIGAFFMFSEKKEVKHGKDDKEKRNR